MMTDEQLQKKIEYVKNKGKRGGARPNTGGARPGAGRPKKLDEYQLIEKLRPMAETAFQVLHQKVMEGDIKALQIYFSYYLGLPTQKIESKIEGQLNQVQIKVVKPANFDEAEIVT
jgi:hypothetical protein